jgi:DNA-binding response OmpR family regulator
MESILLVEDEPANMRVLAAYLKQAGYAIDQAEDGRAAMRKLGENPDYALVVTDRRMPNMDGMQLFAEMQRNPRLRKIPVIMQTAADTPEEVVEGIKAGVYYYLTKPYQEETLLSLVRSAIRDRQQNDVFEQRLSQQKEALGTFVNGEFHLQTPTEAQNVAFMLGILFPRPEVAVSGLYELLINAIEHGNLGIGYQEKGLLLEKGEWESEIERRLAAPANMNKKVQIQFAHHKNQLQAIISDEGQGFDWRPFLEIEPARATQNHGRGIAKANLLAFDHLLYLGTGNQVQVLTTVK